MKNNVRFLLAASALATLSLQSYAQTTTPPTDNTKANATDQSHTTMSADAQSNDATDLVLTKRIRRSIIADKALSTYAHNVKIVAVNGTVTLNGVVRSVDEKNSVERKAASVAGQSHVVNDLTIAPPK